MLQTKLKPKLCCGMASQLSHSKSSELFSAMGHPCAHSHHNSSHLSNYLLRYETMNSGNNRRTHREKQEPQNQTWRMLWGNGRALCLTGPAPHPESEVCGHKTSPTKTRAAFCFKGHTSPPWHSNIHYGNIHLKKKKLHYQSQSKETEDSDGFQLRTVAVHHIPYERMGRQKSSTVNEHRLH